MASSLSLAIPVRSEKEADKELARLLLTLPKVVKDAKKADRPVFVLPNYKFTTESEAIAFFALVPAALELATKEKWFASRMLIKGGAEGHLMMALGCLMTEETFGETMEELDTADSCDACGKKCVPSKCGGCGMARYCGKDCQKSDWKNHKGNCRKTCEEYKKNKIAIQ
jgi:hypothetical protein